MKPKTGTEILLMVHKRIKNYLQNYKGNSRVVDILETDGDSILLSYTGGRQSFIYVRVRDSSTGKFHFLSVPNNMRSCKDAIAWTFGMSKAEFNPIKET